MSKSTARITIIDRIISTILTVVLLNTPINLFYFKEKIIQVTAMSAMQLLVRRIVSKETGEHTLGFKAQDFVIQSI